MVPLTEALAETNEKFDVITVLEVIEHVEAPLAFLSACRRCLAPGGSLFLSTMNRTAKSYLVTIVAAEQLLGLVPSGNICLQHNQAYTYTNLTIF